MALDHAKPHQVIDLAAFGSDHSAALVKHQKFEVMRLVIQPEKPIPTHKVDGPATVQCLQGACDFQIEDTSNPMKAGDWLYMEGGEEHAVIAETPTVLLVTILFKRD